MRTLKVLITTTGVIVDALIPISDTVCDPDPTLTKVTKLFQFKYLVSVLSVFRCINKLLVEQARLWIIHRINTGL